mmetsp:Transcript_37619/g.118614  ORF Transcript_37619/g.118614 Transcript_37619/m.118614 type:complete len:276 (+) Transcript_37619:1039-1866(+)
MGAGLREDRDGVLALPHHALGPGCARVDRLPLGDFHPPALVLPGIRAPRGALQWEPRLRRAAGGAGWRHGRPLHHPAPVRGGGVGGGQRGRGRRVHVGRLPGHGRAAGHDDRGLVRGLRPPGPRCNRVQEWGRGRSDRLPRGAARGACYRAGARRRGGGRLQQPQRGGGGGGELPRDPGRCHAGVRVVSRDTEAVLARGEQVGPRRRDRESNLPGGGGLLRPRRDRVRRGQTFLSGWVVVWAERFQMLKLSSPGRWGSEPISGEMCVCGKPCVGV